MALTITTGRPRKVANKKVRNIEILFDNSYAEGGEAVTPAEMGFRRVDASSWQIINGSESSTLRPTNCYYSGGKLHLIDSATGKEIEGTKDMSKVKVRGTVEGV